MTNSVVLVLLALFLNGSVQAQGNSWQTYSPSDSRFSVELPAPLRKVMSFEAEQRASLALDQKMKGASCYAAIETTPGESRFGIIVIPAKYLSKISMSKEGVFRSLSYTFLADDDEPQFLKPPLELIQNGLSGKEYIYIKDSKYSGSLYTRGRILDAGSAFYVLVYVGRDEKDLLSFDANRFLNSFRVRGFKKRARTFKTQVKRRGSMYSSSSTVGEFENFIARDVVAYIDQLYRM